MSRPYLAEVKNAQFSRFSFSKKFFDPREYQKVNLSVKIFARWVAVRALGIRIAPDALTRRGEAGFAASENQKCNFRQKRKLSKVACFLFLSFLKFAQISILSQLVFQKGCFKEHAY